ncbi:MAG: M1 family metallopeptidase, partial [Gemmatimonadales bacterium]
MLTVLLLLQTASPLAARADTIHPVHDALHYDITLVPSDTGNHVLAEVQTTWRLRSAEPVAMELDSAMRVVRVLVDGKPNTRLSRTLYARSEGEIEVPHEKPAGDTLTTRVRYHGQVRDGLIIGANQYGARTIFADNWPDRAHLWLASQDHPSDKATVAFHVQASVNDQVIANGVLEKIDTLAYGHVVWHYRMDRPIPVYTMVVGIGRMARVRLPDGNCQQSCIPVTLLTYPEVSAYAVNDPFRRAGEILRYYSDLVGPFPYGSLAHVESSTRFGGMENSTAIFYDEKRYRKQNLGEPVVAHETAHQWFGDAVTEGDWHHLWLSEGFATYLAALWQAHVDGDSAFRAGMRRMADEVFQSKEVGQPILDTTAKDLVGLLNSNNYQKGAWVLHQLRGLVGDSAFFSGLRRYYSTFRDSTAFSADFARIMSEAAGRDLE